MSRILIVFTFLFVAIAPAVAQTDADRQARINRALDQLPDRADVEAAMDRLPDFSGTLNGLAEIANDEGNQATLERLLGRLEGEFSSIEAEMVQGDIPDINAVIERLLLLPTDREFMGDALDLAFQVQDVMVEALPEDAKP